MTKPDFNFTKNHFLSCDWGTTSFRLKMADIQTGDVLESLATDYGIKKAHSEFLEENDESDREDFFLRYLQEKIDQLESTSGQNLKNIPLMISGMASSNLGLKELPYAKLPIDLDPSQLNVFTREATPGFPFHLMLISGISTEDDVIRGEETQIFGFADKLEDRETIVILPGTHSKHVIIRNKQIVDFKTYMTGEIFQLLSTQSILRGSLSANNKMFRNEAFIKGVKESADVNILNALFKIRAGDILYKTDKADNAAFLSGLLIGQELKGLRDFKANQIFLAGEGHLKNFYSAALDATVLSDTETEHLTVKGHQFILNYSQKSRT